MIKLRFVLWFGFLILSIVAAHFKLRLFPHIIILFLLFIPLFSILFALWNKKQIKCELEPINKQVDRHEMAQWTLSIKNNSKFQGALLLFNIENQSTQEYYLKPQQMIQVSLEKISEHVGIIESPVFTLKYLDSFRLFKLSIPAIKQSSILVLPLLNSPLFSKQISDEVILETQTALRASYLASDNLESIRPMQLGDPKNRIHWKVSARLQDWFIRHEETGPQQQVELILLPDSPSFNLDQRDAFLDVSCIQLSYFLQNKLTVLFQNTFYQELGQLHQARIKIASIDYKHNLSPIISSSQNIIIYFVENLTESLILSIVEQSIKSLIYVFNPHQERNLLDLAYFHQLKLIINENNIL